MKKHILFSLALAALLTACGANGVQTPSPAQTQNTVANEQKPAEQNEAQKPAEPQKAEGAENALDLAAVRDEMRKSAGTAEAMPMDAAALAGLYGISEDGIKQAAGFAAMTGGFADEVALFEAADEAAADEIQKALQTRLDDVLVQAKAYSPEDYALAQKCTVSRNGTFVAYIFSPAQQKLREVYSGYVK